MALLKSHNHEDINAQVRGIGKSTRVEAAFFENDPLVAGNTTTDNKPGRSIPSMFARMIFFRTAFESVVESGKININGNDGIPVYHRLVSLCLDVLYLVYTRDPRLKVRRWSYAEQIEKLKDHEILLEALKTQRNSYLTKKGTFKTDDIYLFFLNGKLIGGTSPFTFAFASPDWNGLGQIKSLKQRDADFREYAYYLFCAYSGNEMMREFMDYVKLCKRTEPDISLRDLNPALITDQELITKYSQYSPSDDGNQRVFVSQIPSIPFFATKPEDFTSDFFIKSSYQNEINTLNTPLFLHEGYYDDLKYVGTTNWDSDIRFTGIADDENDNTKRKLPGRNDNHIWLSEADFLEESLIELPYEVDTEKFLVIVDGSTSYLLPLRPMFFKYFKMKDLEDMFSYEVKESKCTISLKIPVTNTTGSSTNTLTVTKKYDLKNDVQHWGRDGESINIGVFPFYRILKSPKIFAGIRNRYAVMHNINQQGKMFDTSMLKFYIEGTKKNLDVVETKVKDTSIYYNIESEFDYIQLCWERSDLKINGIAIPLFNTDILSGENDFAYGIDFGTTNTHVAYMESGANNPVSFNAEQIVHSAAFLNKLITPYSHSCGKENAVFLEIEKRRFFPHVADDSYSFPFRTTTIKQGVIDDNATLFGNIAIGFNYRKEFSNNGEYETGLKWKLDNKHADTIITTQCYRFFEELMWMVKNHWITCETANKLNTPKVVITYPLAMSKSLLNKWREIYIKVFGCNSDIAKDCVSEMVESLAPCYSLINRTGADEPGILNIDIGGGTTDLQYYRCYSPVGKVVTLAFYNSVKFAGDDLWGKGYENLEIAKGSDNVNNFTKAAEIVCKNVDIQLDENVKIRLNDGNSKNSILGVMDPKELVNILLRDTKGTFTDWLCEKGNTNVCRKTMFLHYTAIIYYSSMWMRDHEMDCPGVIQFTGLGSKYINLLFDDDNKLTKYTRDIIENVGVSNIPEVFEVKTSEEGQNPKAATAEGAALKVIQPEKLPKNEKKFHVGIDGKAVRLKGNKLSAAKDDLMMSFEKFLELYNSLPEEIDDVRRPQLTSNEIISFKALAKQSLQKVITYYTAEFGGDAPQSVNDPMFFWPFKGALHKLPFDVK